ncbi:MAG: Zn-dependent hydrolase [Syntrophobacterales bacterium]|nr:MAG: Zn-dependent hydrolase [Syntrophobacterales bacterium]
MQVQIGRIKKDIDAIGEFTATPGKGITRLTFSQEYEKARSYIVEELRKIDAKVSITVAGNLRGRLEGSDKGKPVVMLGSHIDSVYQGGRFDGVVGVVSALEAARVIVDNNIAHRYPIDVVVFPEEEGSRFGSILVGSRAWAGKLSLDELSRLKDEQGIDYLKAMKQMDITPEDENILIPEQVKAMLELHIEQSLVLESKSLKIGVVEAIAGIRQFSVTLNGVSNHAGATPMSLRFDALQGAAEIISAVEDIANQHARKSTVATVGFLKCEPGQANVIPGRVQFTLDIRDTDSGSLDETVEKITTLIANTCQNRGLTYNLEPRSDTPPVVLSEKMVHLIERIARKRKLGTLRMISGALHDSSILAELTDVGMIFIPSKRGRSHCPEEFTDIGDIELGANVLLETAIELAT